MASKVIYVDDRLGAARWVYGDPTKLMQIPDEVRESVVFIYCRQDLGFRAVGTAFFVAYPSPVLPPGLGWPYLVTAKHVIDGIRLHSSDGIVHVRVNLVSGGIADVEMQDTDWVLPPEDWSEYVDVAVANWVRTPQPVRFKTVPLVSFVDDEAIQRENIGLGDELLITGLFVNHSGTGQNLPIARMGNIAAMPEEPVETREGRMQAYLVEARSIGGLSGSPVFVDTGHGRYNKYGAEIAFTRRFHLLGLMRGHWERERDLEDPEEAELVNKGIAIVVPSQKIRDMLEQPRLQKERREDEEKAVSGGLPTSDSANDESPEFERFEDLTRKLSHTPKPKPSKGPEKE